MQSLKHEINIYNEDNPNRMLHYVPIKNKGLDNSNERDILINKIEKLTLKNAALEEHASNLQNNLQDLRKVLELTGKQSSQEMRQIHARNVALKQEIKRLESALKYSLRDGNHMQKCAMYWDMFA